MVGSIENVVDRLNYSLSPKVKDSLKMALHERLMNAVTWGGRRIPTRRHRSIICVHGNSLCAASPIP